MQAPSEPEGLPAPTGRYQVGRVSFDLVDPDRTEIYSSNPEDRREMVAWVWYPATPGSDAERAAYLPELWVPRPGRMRSGSASGRRSATTRPPTWPRWLISSSGFASIRPGHWPAEST
jgi:hypothetical protein